MRVICLGGTGGMGRYAARTAAAFDFVNEIIVADLNAEKPTPLPNSWGPKPGVWQ